MNRFHHWIYDVKDSSTILKRSTFWNLIASILNASMTALILFFLSWTGKKNLTGVFSIATAIAYQVQAIGLFGVRNYHITDVKNKFSFSDYFYINIFSTCIMLFVLIFMSFGRGYTIDKAMIIFTFTLYRGIDIYEALFYDEYQRQDRIDIGLIFQTIRFFVSLILLIGTLLITDSLVLACIVATLGSIVVVMYQNKEFYKIFHCKVNKFNKTNFKKLFSICLPICIAGFISMYLVNAPKYAIDANLTDEIQGIFAILFVPVFTINMIAMVIYRPFITKISHEWHQNDYSLFIKDVVIQIAAILLLTCLIIAFGYILGLRLLGILYHTPLNSYYLEFTILLLGGGMNTLAVFLSQILVIIEEQNKYFIIYIIAALATVILSTPLLVKYQIFGASVLYVAASLILVLLSLFIIIVKVRKERRKCA